MFQTAQQGLLAFARRNSRRVEWNVLQKLSAKFQPILYDNLFRIKILAKLKGSGVFRVRVAEEIIEKILPKMCSTLTARKVLRLILRTYKNIPLPNVTRKPGKRLP